MTKLHAYSKYIYDVDYEKFPKIENILFVQATSPLSESGDFSNMLRALEAYDSVGFYSEDFGFFFDRDDLTKPRLPRQQRLPLKREAGNAWAFKKNGFVKNKSRLFGEIGLCEIDYLKALEIDEPADLELIGCVLNSGI